MVARPLLSIVWNRARSKRPIVRSHSLPLCVGSVFLAVLEAHRSEASSPTLVHRRIVTYGTLGDYVIHYVQGKVLMDNIVSSTTPLE
jgi:hypothetical protein